MFLYQNNGFIFLSCQSIYIKTKTGSSSLLSFLISSLQLDYVLLHMYYSV